MYIFREYHKLFHHGPYSDIKFNQGDFHDRIPWSSMEFHEIYTQLYAPPFQLLSDRDAEIAQQ